MVFLVFQNLTAARNVAYCPYSKFRVGCAILTASGEYVIGTKCSRKLTHSKERMSKMLLTVLDGIGLN